MLFLYITVRNRYKEDLKDFCCTIFLALFLSKLLHFSPRK